MKALCQLIGLVLLATLALTGLGTAVAIGAGAVLSRCLPLSLFEASALAIGATIAIVLVVHVVTTMVHLQSQHTWEHDAFAWEPHDEDDGIPVFSQPDSQKVGRNAPCPCGSGKKYKNCCAKAPAR